ncbi:Homocysteine S-methyltransferase 1 [Tolypocladium ophioglossoides CBS 100239]|uniref:Homocysteine S-methyltransferase 1 n=1 Tax=Tolypocladium ophioglossoides (strain CBS 100239) TaxID=1163406 RepID=A0A0L0N0Z5_TOLOC|nr:Homocysteine S-methyltransferase 1 [Tolypocladium ophioglossoides CBS 100239]
MPPILILDGGLGTALEQEYNLTFSGATPLWSSHLLVSDPDTLLACQADFGRGVPVDVLLTATYQVSVAGFAGTRTAAFPQGIDSARIPGYLDAAVRIAARATQRDDAERDAAAPAPAVALSLGPYGACMVPSQEYSGAYDDAHGSRAALREWHLARMRLFAGVPELSSRVAYVALETIPRVDEIEAMRQALDSVPELSSVPFWMSCLYPGDAEALPDGSTPEGAVRAMLDPNTSDAVPWGVGINCTKVWKGDPLLRRYEAAIAGMLRDGLVRDWPALVLYPDGTNGEVYNTTTQAWELPDDAATNGERASWEEQLAGVPSVPAPHSM